MPCLQLSSVECVVQMSFIRYLLSCYPNGTITSGRRYADLGGDADVDAALVQHLQYAIPPARLSSTGRRSPEHGFGRVWHITLSAMTI